MIYKKSALNVILLVLFSAIRYGAIAFSYSLLSIEDVGRINAILTFVTTITFFAGFEAHQVVNRPLLTGKTNVIRYGLDRQFSALVCIFLCSFSSQFILTKGNFDHLLQLVFFASILEYLSLEAGRLLVIKGSYLFATTSSFLRSISPYFSIFIGFTSLESMLISWVVGAFCVLLCQAFVLIRSRHFSLSICCLERSEYIAILHFFVAGVSMASLPSLERWLINGYYSPVILGQYALSVTLTSVCSVFLQGFIWQPFIKRVVVMLGDPLRRAYISRVLIGVTSLVYLFAFVIFYLFSNELMSMINKPPIPLPMVAGVFILGLAKSLYTLLFYCFYATNRERRLHSLQFLLAAIIFLFLIAGSKSDFDAGILVGATGIAWIMLILFYLFRWLNIDLVANP